MTTATQAQRLDDQITADERLRAARLAIVKGDVVRVPNHPSYVGRVTAASTYLVRVLFADGDHHEYGRHEVWPEGVDFA